MTTLFTYIPESVVCLVAGVLPVEGYLDGTFIRIDKVKAPFQSITTPDGTTARLQNEDKTYTVSITLHNGSSSNDVLTKLWQLDEITGRGKFPLLIRDGSGSDLFFSTTTWIEQPPSIVKSNGVDGRTWVLKSSYAIINIGGNDSPSDIVDDIINIALSALPSLSGIL
jgi:hypothetical protein